MANELDETVGPVNAQGRDVNVIDKQLPVKITFGSTLFELFIYLIWIAPLVFVFSPAGACMEDHWKVILCCAGFLPGIIYFFEKIAAKNYFRQLQQKIQADASQIDNYLEQRVMILKNAAQLVSKAIDLDKDVMATVARYRGGNLSDSERNRAQSDIDRAFGRLFPQVEAYPELKAHEAIQEAMRENAILQKEITAARTLYNDTVAMWNTDVFEWPVKMIVAARAGYTTRIPFSASAEIKSAARGTFF